MIAVFFASSHSSAVPTSDLTVCSIRSTHSIRSTRSIRSVRSIRCICTVCIVCTVRYVLRPLRPLHPIQDPPHAYKKLRNSFFNKNRTLQFNKLKISWAVIEALLDLKNAKSGLDYLPQLTAAAVKLTSWTKMRVGLAAGVMNQKVANKILLDVVPTISMDEDTIKGTAKYVSTVARFYEIMTDTKAFESMADPRFAELDAILGWFMQWKKWIDEQVGKALALPSSTAKEVEARTTAIKEAKSMFITDEAYEDLQICINGFKNSCRYLFPRYPFMHIYARSMSTNSLEAFFSLARATGGHDGRVTARHMQVAHMYFMSMRAYTNHLKKLNTSYEMPTADDVERNWVRGEDFGGGDGLQDAHGTQVKSADQLAKEQAEKDVAAEEQVRRDRELWDQDHLPKELDDEWMVELYFGN